MNKDLTLGREELKCLSYALTGNYNIKDMGCDL